MNTQQLAGKIRTIYDNRRGQKNETGSTIRCK